MIAVAVILILDVRIGDRRRHVHSRTLLLRKAGHADPPAQPPQGGEHVGAATHQRHEAQAGGQEGQRQARSKQKQRQRNADPGMAIDLCRHGPTGPRAAMPIMPPAPAGRLAGRGKMPKPAATVRVPSGQAKSRHMRMSAASCRSARACPRQAGGARNASAAKPNVCSSRSAAIAPSGPSRLATVAPIGVVEAGIVGMIADQGQRARPRRPANSSSPAPRRSSMRVSRASARARIGQGVAHRAARARG